MDLVENYLAAVDARLPKEQGADVIAELRDTLLTKLEEQEAALGRPPSREETAAMLKAFGHPLVVAGRYRKHQQLIGPEVYPFYVVTLQWVLGAVVFLHIVLTALSVSSLRDPTVALARFWNGALPGLLGAFGIVTIVFLVIERAGGGAHLARSWSPKSLSAGPRSRSIWETLFEMAFEIVFLLFWSGVIPWPDFPNVAHPGPIWETLRWPIFAVVAVSFAVNALSLLQPGRLWGIAAGRVAVALASLAIILMLIGSEQIFVIEAPERYLAYLGWLSWSAKLALAVAATIWLFEAFAAVRRAYRTRGAAS